MRISPLTVAILSQVISFQSLMFASAHRNDTDEVGVHDDDSISETEERVDPEERREAEEARRAEAEERREAEEARQAEAVEQRQADIEERRQQLEEKREQAELERETQSDIEPDPISKDSEIVEQVDSTEER
ncbi:MAG: hypothetical protein HRU09_19370 [Oligoflexales bacterium]|nr:hypothetical protein [Oligoflexales bacterium]